MLRTTSRLASITSSTNGPLSSIIRSYTSKTYSQKEALKILDSHFSPAVPRAPKGNNMVCASALGSWITDIDGKKYLDLQTGIGVQSTGHCHPNVVKAVQEQMTKGIHLQQNCMISQPMVHLCEKLTEITPKGLNRYFFNVTGSEAIESAVKLARHETGRQNVIVFNGGFHGRSLTTLGMTTSKTAYRIGYGPFPPAIHTAKFPYCLHCPVGGDNKPKSSCCGDAMETLRTMLKEQSPPSDTAAIVIEPILGEGGYVVPPPGFMKQLRQLCDEYGILLVADEVQSGVGRTGKWWATEHEDIIPDILVFAKGIASGVPLSGIATAEHRMKKSPPGSMGGTFGATAVSCAAAVATIETIQQENLTGNADKRGQQLMKGLRKLQVKYPEHILEVRGRGCMVGFEFNHPAGSGISGAVTAAAMNHGLMLLTTGWRETIRFIPPLVITEKEVDTALSMFEKALDDVLPTWKASKPLA